MLTEQQAARLADRIAFQETIILDDVRDFDFNCVVDGLLFEELMIKIETVADDWWKEAQIKH